jgi:hypothetical protein
MVVTMAHRSPSADDDDAPPDSGSTLALLMDVEANHAFRALCATPRRDRAKRPAPRSRAQARVADDAAAALPPSTPER